MTPLTLEQEYILKWLRNNCNGVENATTRDKILPYVQHLLNCDSTKPEDIDRAFRRVISSLKRIDLVGATHRFGYWAIKLDNVKEINAAIASIEEMNSKAYTMIDGNSLRLKVLRDRLQVVDKGQQTLPL